MLYLGLKQTVMIKFGLVMLSIVISIGVESQITFQKEFGGVDNDFGLSINTTPDGGYILFGSTSSFGLGQLNMYLVKTDNLGNELWHKTFGESGFNFGVSAKNTSDGGFVIAGGHGGVVNDSLTIIKTDSLGAELWAAYFNGTVGRDVAQSVIESNDNGIVAVGFIDNGLDYDMFIVKTDANGIEQWSHSYIATGNNIGNCVRQTSDNGYVLLGETNGSGNGGKDFYLVRTNQDGDTLWTKTYGGQMDEIGKSIDLTVDGGFILLGYEAFSGGDIILIKVDQFGNELWNYSYGDSGSEEGHSISQTDDNGFIISGRKYNSLTGNDDMYSLKLDEFGSLQWDKTFPNGIISDAYSVQQTDDGGYVMLGSTVDESTFDSNMYLVKMDPNGVVQISEEEQIDIVFSFYPNPAIDYILINTSIDLNQNFSLCIFDSRGSLVKEFDQIQNGETLINIDSWKADLYTYKLSLEESSYQTTGHAFIKINN